MSQNSLTLDASADYLGVTQKLIRKWLKTGKLKGTKSHKWSIPMEQIQAFKERQLIMKSWSRLVDVTQKLGIHRNHGESLCRREGLPIEKDFSDDYRVPPEVEAYLVSQVALKKEQENWILLQDLASKMGLAVNVLNGGLHRLGLAFDYDLSGQIIFPKETGRKLVEWRVSLAEGKKSVSEREGESLIKLRRTAEESALFFAAPGTPEYIAKVETLCSRYRSWIKRGLSSVRMGRAYYFTEDVHRVLLDEISRSEAAKLTGISKNTINSWAQKKWLTELAIAPTRRSYSRAGLIRLLRERFRNESKLKKRGHVPVQLLPRFSKLAEELGTSELVLSRSLRLVGNASQEDIKAIHCGQGLIKRDVWMTIERWQKDVSQGHLPSYESYRFPKESSDVKEFKATELISILSFLTGASLEKLGELSKVRFTQTFTSFEVIEICRLLSENEGRLSLYNPSGKFDLGDVLIDPLGHDFGKVVHRIDDTVVDVDWRWRGRLRMRCR